MLFLLLSGRGIFLSPDVSREAKTPFSGTAENKENLNCPITLSITPPKACLQAQPAAPSTNRLRRGGKPREEGRPRGYVCHLGARGAQPGAPQFTTAALLVLTHRARGWGSAGGAGRSAAVPGGGRAAGSTRGRGRVMQSFVPEKRVTAQPCFHPGPTAAETVARRRQRWSPARLSKVSGSAPLLAPALCTAPRGTAPSCTTSPRAAPRSAASSCTACWDALQRAAPRGTVLRCMAAHGTAPHLVAPCCAAWQHVAPHRTSWHRAAPCCTLCHRAALHGSTWHRTTPRGTTPHLVAPCCAAWQHVALHHTSWHRAALHGSTWHCTTPRGTVLCCMAACDIAPHLVAPHCTSWHCAALLRCTALHHVQCTALQLAVLRCTPWHHAAPSSSTFVQCVSQHLPQPLTAPCPQPQTSPAGSRCVQQDHGAAAFLQVPPGLGGQELGGERRRAVGYGAELRVSWHRGLILPQAAPN